MQCLIKCSLSTSVLLCLKSGYGVLQSCSKDGVRQDRLLSLGRMYVFCVSFIIKRLGILDARSHGETVSEES